MLIQQYIQWSMHSYISYSFIRYSSCNLIVPYNIFPLCVALVPTQFLRARGQPQNSILLLKRTQVLYTLPKYILNKEDFLHSIENLLVSMPIFNFGTFFNGCKSTENGGFLFSFNGSAMPFH